MLYKLIVIITALGATSAALLVNRQQRIEAAHEMAELHARLHEHDRTLWRMESEIAARCRPDHLRHAMNQIRVAWCPMQAAGRPRESPAVQLASGESGRHATGGG